MFETARQEVARGSVRIDCLMDIGNKKNKLPIDSTELAVEIKVSHAVDEQKRLKLRELGLQTIEINLTKLADPDAAPSTEEIRKAICDTPLNIKWVDLEKPEVRQLAMDLERQGAEIPDEGQAEAVELNGEDLTPEQHRRLARARLKKVLSKLQWSNQSFPSSSKKKPRKAPKGKHSRRRNWRRR